MNPDGMPSLPSSRFQELMGFEIHEWRNGATLLHLPVRVEHINRNGIVHGGVLMTLLDTACGLSAGYNDSDGQLLRVATIMLTCNFLRPVKSSLLRASGRRLEGGKLIRHCMGEIVDADGRAIATAQGSFRVYIDQLAGEAVE